MADIDSASVLRLREIASELVGDPELAVTLVNLLAGAFHKSAALPSRVQQLVRMGLVRINTVPFFEAIPIELHAGELPTEVDDTSTGAAPVPEESDDDDDLPPAEESPGELPGLPTAIDSPRDAPQ